MMGDQGGLDQSSYCQYKNANRTFRRLFRRCSKDTLSALDRDIDRETELDSVQFWKMVKSMLKPNNTGAGAAINFNGEICRDWVKITEKWDKYFGDLYKPSKSDIYVEQGRESGSAHVLDTFNNLHPDPSLFVDCDFVKSCIKNCPNRKADGDN